MQAASFFTMKEYIDDFAAPIDMSSTSTIIHHIVGNMPRLYAPLELGVCTKSAKVLVPPWPPPFRPAIGPGGVADSKLLVRTRVELELRMTQMQEGEDDEDIPSIDTTMSIAQQRPMTQAQAQQLNY